MRGELALILGVAIALRLALVGQTPFLSDDVYRYVWDGKVQALGINPIGLSRKRPSSQRSRALLRFSIIMYAPHGSGTRIAFDVAQFVVLGGLLAAGAAGVFPRGSRSPVTRRTTTESPPS